YADAGHPDQVTEEAYWGVQEQPQLNFAGVARTKCAYDEQGNRVKCAFLGLQGQPTVSGIDGYARWAAAFDQRGNQTSWEFYDAPDGPALIHLNIRGIPIPRKGGTLDQTALREQAFNVWIQELFSQWTATYDRQDYCTTRTYSGCDGKQGFT